MLKIWCLFGAKMLIDAQITSQNRNSRWRPSAILDFPKFDFCPVELLRQLIFHIATKFGAKMLIDAEIMDKKTDLIICPMLWYSNGTDKNRNLRWRPSAILEFLYHRIGPPT